MNCNNCGMSVSETAKFCNRCGANVATSGGNTPAEATGSYDQAGRPSPVTALFTDPPPETSYSKNCANHGNTPAFAACVSCAASYCRHCLINDSGSHYCRSCAARLRTPPAQQTQGYQQQPYQPGNQQPPYQQPYQPANQQPPYQQPYQQANQPPPYQQPYQTPAYQPPYQQLPAPYQYQNPYFNPVVPYAKRKEPALALVLSIFLPGVGQLYNGDVGKGIAMMLGFWILIWFGIGIGFWIWSMIDAYQSAQNINLGRRY